MYSVDWDDLVVVHDLHPEYVSTLHALELPSVARWPSSITEPTWHQSWQSDRLGKGELWASVLTAQATATMELSGEASFSRAA